VKGFSGFLILMFSGAAAWAQAPVVLDKGVTNGASFGLAPNAAVAPGSLISIFGTNLASGLASADSIPLSATLAGVSVKIGGIAAPLNSMCHLCVGGVGDQLNVQMPWGVQGSSAQVTVTFNNNTSAPVTTPVAPFNPGIFSVNSGVGIAIAQIFPDNALAAPAGSIPGIKTRPAKAGDTLQILATGLGAVDSPIADGANSLDKLRNTVTKPVVLVGSIPAPPVGFSGLSPQFVGINQVNAQVPTGAPTGDAVSLQLQIGGLTSTNQVTIAVSN
jgi:uncharacterized protein (TIGR03437 family)